MDVAIASFFLTTYTRKAYITENKGLPGSVPTSIYVGMMAVFFVMSFIEGRQEGKANTQLLFHLLFRLSAFMIFLQGRESDGVESENGEVGRRGRDREEGGDFPYMYGREGKEHDEAKEVVI